MNVKQLRETIANLDDDVQVTVQVSEEQGECSTSYVYYSKWRFGRPGDVCITAPRYKGSNQFLKSLFFECKA